MSNLIRHARPIAGAIITGLLALAVGVMLLLAIIAVLWTVKITHA